MIQVPLPRVFGFRRLLLLLCAFALAVGSAALVSWLHERAREHRRQAVELRHEACACADKACAVRTAKALYRLDSLDEAAERARIQGYICLGRFSDTCTLGDLIWPEKFKPHMGRRAHMKK